MARCLITYDEIPEGEHYSSRGLRQLSPRLERLEIFPYSVAEQVQEAGARAARMSVQGVQPKLSARLNTGLGQFEVVDIGGRYIIKPQNPLYPELPENEDLTMRMASVMGIEVPLHGLLHCADGSRSYFIRRFDRIAGDGKLAVEDFAQVSGRDRETKYDSSLEQVARLLDFCSFPAVERERLFVRVLFNYLTGNEDMHLKNHSLITRRGRVELAPAYDYLNTVAVYRKFRRGSIEETALPLKGKKKKLTRNDWLKYFAVEQLALNEKIVRRILEQFAQARDVWADLLDRSFLSGEMRKLYRAVLEDRFAVLFEQPKVEKPVCGLDEGNRSTTLWFP